MVMTPLRAITGKADASGRGKNLSSPSVLLAGQRGRGDGIPEGPAQPGGPHALGTCGSPRTAGKPHSAHVRPCPSVRQT